MSGTPRAHLASARVAKMVLSLARACSAVCRAAAANGRSASAAWTFTTQAQAIGRVRALSTFEFSSENFRDPKLPHGLEVPKHTGPVCVCVCVCVCVLLHVHHYWLHTQCSLRLAHPQPTAHRTSHTAHKPWSIIAPALAPAPARRLHCSSNVCTAAAPHAWPVCA